MSVSAVSIPNDVRPGEPVRAEHFNAVLALLRSTSSLRVGDGLTMTRTALGLVIGLNRAGAGRGQVEWIDAVVLAVTAPAGTPQKPSDVRYTVRAVGRPDIEDATLTPKYGRPIRGEESSIYPAEVGDLCVLLRRPRRDSSGGTEAELYILSETAAVGGCQ